MATILMLQTAAPDPHDPDDPDERNTSSGGAMVDPAAARDPFFEEDADSPLSLRALADDADSLADAAESEADDAESAANATSTSEAATAHLDDAPTAPAQASGSGGLHMCAATPCA